MQNKANFRKSQMNVIKALTMEYKNKTLSGSGKNKANSKPKQSQTNPIKANKMPKQTQYKPKQSQFQALGDSGFGCTASCLFGFSLRSCLQESIVVFCRSYLRRACEVALNAMKIPSISKGD